VFQIGTGSGSAVVPTAIAVGFPTILTASAHGLHNGDRVAMAGFTGANAADLNGNTYTVRYVETNTFGVDQDTTGHTITVSGSQTMTPVTFTTVDNVRTLNGLDGAAVEIDRTNLASTAKEFILGLQDPGHITFECDHDTTDAGQAAVLSHQASGGIANFKIIMPNGTTTWTFNGFVKKFGMTAGVDQIIKRQGEVRITGAVTFTP
jgi:hypothetical protein